MIKSKEGRTKGRVKVVEAINNEIPEVAVARDNDQLRRQDYLKLHYSITAAATTNCTGVEVPQYTYADIEVTCTDDFPLANNTHLEKPIEFFKQCNLIDVVGDTLLLQCPRSPTCFTGDGCAVNLKGCSVLDEIFGRAFHMRGGGPPRGVRPQTPPHLENSAPPTDRGPGVTVEVPNSVIGGN